jgi:hypothetical protein
VAATPVAFREAADGGGGVGVGVGVADFLNTFENGFLIDLPLNILSMLSKNLDLKSYNYN